MTIGLPVKLSMRFAQVVSNNFTLQVRICGVEATSQISHENEQTLYGRVNN